MVLLEEGYLRVVCEVVELVVVVEWLGLKHVLGQWLLECVNFGQIAVKYYLHVA